MWTYSLIWMNRNVAPSTNVVSDPGLEPEAVVRLGALERPVHRERRREQDRRVDAGDQLRQLGARRRPRVAVHDPDEEVGREEGPEDHDLGDDEKQHPEQLRRRRARSGWPRAGRGGGRRGRRRAATAAASIRRPPRPWPRCARPACRCRARTRSTSLSATHCGAVGGQRRDHDLRDVEVLRRRSSPPCTGRGRRSCRRPRSCSERSDVEQLLAAARAPRAPRGPSPESCGTTTMKRCGPSSASFFEALDELARRPTVWLASTSVTSNGRPSASTSTTTCSTGRPVSLSQPLDQVAPQPARGRRPAAWRR